MYAGVRGRSKWNARKVVVVCVLVLLLVLFLVVIGFSIYKEAFPRYCLNQECIQASARLLKSLDPNQDPCQNLYKFTCDRYLEKVRHTGIKSELHNWKSRAQKQYHDLFLEDGIESEVQVNLRWLYKACMDEDEIRENGLEYLRRILEGVGGWPAVDARWDGGYFDWLRMIVRLRRRGLYYESIFGFEVVPNEKENKYYLKISQARQERLDLEFVNHIANALGSKYVRRDLQRVGEFNKQLTNINTTNITWMQLSDVQEVSPQINWMEFLNHISSVQLDPEDLVAFEVDHESLFTLLSTTPKRVVANYMVVQVINHLDIWLRESSPKKRDKLCVDQVNSLYPYISYYLYAEKYAPNEARNDVMKMLKSVNRQYRRTLNKLTWMDQSTKKIFLHKLEDMLQSIAGYPIDGVDVLPELSHAKSIYLRDQDNYLNTVTKFQLEAENFQFSRLRKSTQFNRVLESAHLIKEVDAFYGSSNVMVIPAAIIQMLYNKELPDYLNYALLPSIAGHEISHAILSNSDPWWSEMFEETAQCMTELYENYTLQNFQIELNGTKALVENISDLLGLHVGYQAFLENYSWTRNPSLAGLDGFTAKQLFWIVNARFYCNPDEVEELEKGHLVHAASSFRVNGPVAQLGYFAKDFNCPLGSPMNPEKKCGVF